MNGPRRVRFLVDDPMGKWKRHDLGWEIEHITTDGVEEVAVVVRLSATGKEVTLPDPYERGILALDA